MLCKERTGTVNVAQSRKLTRSGYSYTLTQKKLLYEIILRVQFLYRNRHVSDGLVASMEEVSALSGTVFSIPVGAFLGKGSKNHAYVRKELEGMVRKSVRVNEGPEGWRTVSIFDFIRSEKGSGVILVRMTRSFYEMMSNIAGGLSVYDCGVARNLPSVYAMRMFEFIARWGGKRMPPVPAEDLREMMGVNVRDGGTLVRRYPEPAKFERHVLDTARKALSDERYGTGCTFTYERVKDAAGRPAYAITVTECGARRSGAGSIYLSLGTDVVNKLREMGWSRKSVENNLGMLEEAKRMLDLPAELSLLNGQSRGKRNPVGYVVNGLKGKIADRKTG